MGYGIFNVRTDVNACDCTRGCTDTVRESALKVNSGRKILCCTWESNLRQRCAGPTLYRLSYIPTPSDGQGAEPSSLRFKGAPIGEVPWPVNVENVPVALFSFAGYVRLFYIIMHGNPSIRL